MATNKAYLNPNNIIINERWALEILKSNDEFIEGVAHNHNWLYGSVPFKLFKNNTIETNKSTTGFTKNLPKYIINQIYNVC